MIYLFIYFPLELFPQNTHFTLSVSIPFIRIVPCLSFRKFSFRFFLLSLVSSRARRNTKTILMATKNCWAYSAFHRNKITFFIVFRTVSLLLYNYIFAREMMSKAIHFNLLFTEIFSFPFWPRGNLWLHKFVFNSPRDIIQFIHIFILYYYSSSARISYLHSTRFRGFTLESFVSPSRLLTTVVWMIDKFYFFAFCFHGSNSS